MSDTMSGERTLDMHDRDVEHTPTELCPKCGGGALQRSKRRAIEYPLSLFHVWPFRCKVCQARLLKFSRASFKY